MLECFRDEIQGKTLEQLLEPIKSDLLKELVTEVVGLIEKLSEGLSDDDANKLKLSMEVTPYVTGKCTKKGIFYTFWERTDAVDSAGKHYHIGLGDVGAPTIIGQGICTRPAHRCLCDDCKNLK